ncbi:hypothetical protein J8N07_07075 [Chryseobacterium arthrosphaerae]|uniref:hypothetical protein n=1 Tax=Chryseobacterium TaxID=59732 RepID=UPI0008109C33|nr:MULTISPECIES: hypothetical protein [Chryseobacterium]OCK51062.1 hypothetical protein BA768_18330 [Chryseobacterium sp. CBo1]UEQ78056.1 hypothetical protein J8N07_07075 [Chryseobacterium arthrosphaerae]VXC33195.1 conserved hypothetical protein [Chryseobacterium sp. 8AT]
MNTTQINNTLVELEDNLKLLKSSREQVDTLAEKTEKLTSKYNEVLKNISSINAALQADEVSFKEKFNTAISNLDKNLASVHQNVESQTSRFSQNVSSSIDNFKMMSNGSINDFSALSSETTQAVKAIVSDFEQHVESSTKNIEEKIQNFSTRTETKFSELSNNVDQKKKEIDETNFFQRLSKIENDIEQLSKSHLIFQEKASKNNTILMAIIAVGFIITWILSFVVK